MDVKHIEADQITLELLQSYYNVPLAELAKELGLSLTLLKKICRKFGIQRWPHRQIRSLNKTAQELKERAQCALTAEEHAEIEAQLQLLEKKKRLVTRGASSGLQSALRNALFLANPEQLEEESVFDVKVPLPAPVPLPSAAQQGRNANPMYKMMQTARAAQAQALDPLAAYKQAAEQQRMQESLYLQQQQRQLAAAAAPQYGAYGHMDQALLQQQMAAQMAQMALQHQMHMNSYMCMAPAPQPAVHQPAPVYAAAAPTPADAADLFEGAPFDELAALLGMSEEDVAMGSSASAMLTVDDEDFMDIMLQDCALPADMVGAPAQQQLPSAMHTGHMMFGAQAPQAAMTPETSFMTMGGWAI
eukprot:TRINITY_DN3021_c0_g1_i4.p1 TRINITY_DN3021_c0_g1~~TRINITY_DN3021_c0_g1_i4.p1  ORF type:complete len:386 (+),score=175.01 TRINITY_DN3021_c0_g1_i4:80-1159(+)